MASTKPAQSREHPRSSRPVTSQTVRAQQLRAAFRAELDDHTRSFNQWLMRLERERSEDGRVEALNTLFRDAHSLKAAAICVEYGPMERLADALQSVFDSARRDRGHPEGAWFDTVYQAIDALAPLHRELVDGETSPAPELLRALEALEIVSPRPAEDDVRASHLVPVTSLLAPLDRVVRDVGHDSAKEVQLFLDGGDIEVDAEILERLRGPLVHIVRNAVDHGIEPPTVREQLGKSNPGTIRISVAQRGRRLRVAVEDDGAGLDPARLRQAAAARGALSTEQALALDDRAAFELIFQPGFTTARQVTMTSGRGVGMDAVRSAVEQLRGTVRATSAKGGGARIVIDVPLTQPRSLRRLRSPG